MADVKPAITPLTPLANKMPLNPQFAPLKPVHNPFGDLQLYKGIGQVAWDPNTTAGGQELGTNVIDQQVPTVAPSVSPTPSNNASNGDDNSPVATSVGHAVQTPNGNIFTPVLDQFGNIIDYGFGILNSADEYLEGLGAPSGSVTNTIIDGVVPSPIPGLGLASTLINPQIKETPWGDDFNTGGGGLIGLAGNLSLANLENQYYKTSKGLSHDGTVGADTAKSKEYSISLSDGKYNYGGESYDTFAEAEAAQNKDVDNTKFYAPGDLPGITDLSTGNTPSTPIAISEGLIPGTKVVSGNTDLLPPQTDSNNDGIISATEVEALADPNSAVAKEIAQINANKAAANQLAQQQQQEKSDNNEGHYSGGTAVTDSKGNAVKSSDGTVVTSGGTWTAPSNNNNDSGGGDSGGGGGGWSVICTALYDRGDYSLNEYKRNAAQVSTMYTMDDIAGYQAWGKYVAPFVRKNNFAAMVWKPIMTAWCNDIAYRSGRSKSTNWLGILCRYTIEQLSLKLRRK